MPSNAGIVAVMVWLAIFSLCCAFLEINFVAIKSRFLVIRIKT